MRIFNKLQQIFSKHHKQKFVKIDLKKPNNGIYRQPKDILLSSKSEAEEVLYDLNHLIQLYELATLADYYDIVGVTSDWTDTHYGWKSIDTACVKRIKNDFLVCLPKAFLIR